MSDDKPRMIEVPTEFLVALKDGGTGLSIPWLYWKGDKAFADADEFRAWCLQHTSETEPK